MASLFDPLYEVGAVEPPSTDEINKKLNEYDLLNAGTMTAKEMYNACQQISNLGFAQKELIAHVKKGPTIAGDGNGQIKINEFAKYLGLESQKKYKQSDTYSNPFANDQSTLKKTSSGMKVMVTPSPNDIETNGSHKVDMSASYSPTEATETDIPNWFGHSLDTVVNHPNDPSVIPSDDLFGFLNTDENINSKNKKKIKSNHMSVATQDILYLTDDASTETVDKSTNLSPKRAKQHKLSKSASASGLLPAPRSKGDKPRKSKSKKKLKLKKHHSAALSFDTDVFADAPTQSQTNKIKKKLQLAKAHSEMVPASTHRLSSKKGKRQKIDAIKEMRRGAAMLKYGRKGFPHFRRFQISADKSKLIWYSRKKKLSETHVAIRDMKEILVGQQTEVFQKCTQKTLEKASFSIVYGLKLKTLDVVAKSAEEAELWVKGIKGLMKANGQGKLHKVVMILVDVDYKDITKTKYKIPSDEERRKYQVQFGNRTELLHIVESTMKEAEVGFDGLNKAVRNENVKQSVEFENISVMMSELEQRLGEIKYGIENKIADLNDLKRDVWVLKVDVTVLEEKIKVLSKIKTKNPI